MSNFEESPRVFIQREEIRGLFTLGLLAVLVSIRIQYGDGITITIDDINHSVTYFFDWMIVLWSFYAFFMILGTSDDLVGKKGSKAFRRYSIYYLYLSFSLLALMAMGFYYEIYPLQAFGLTIFGSVILFYLIVKEIYLKLREFHRQGQINKKNIFNGSKNGLKKLKSEAYQFLFSIAFVCLMLVVAGTKDELIIPSAIIGSLSFITFLFFRDRKKKKQSKISKFCV